MERLVFGPFELDVERLVLSADGTQLALGPKVVETLLALAERPGAASEPPHPAPPASPGGRAPAKAGGSETLRWKQAYYR